MSQSVLLVTILIVFIILVASILKWASDKTDPPLKYVKNFSLLSAPERAFLATLEPLLGDKYRLFAKPRLADIIEIKPHPGHTLSSATQAKIDATTVSFVLCNAKDFAIAGIINLENQSTQSTPNVMQDAFIDNAATEAGLPIIRIPSKLQYDPDNIAEILAENIELPKQTDARSSKNKYGDCPSCGEPLLLLKAKQGENIGKYFLGCSNYPECKYLSLLNDTENVHDITPPQKHDEPTTPEAEQQA